MRLIISTTALCMALLSGCARLQPGYLMSTDMEKAQILYDSGMIIEARDKANDVPKASADYRAARRLLNDIDALASGVSRGFVEIGLRYEKAGLDRKALTYYELALEYDPSNKVAKQKTPMLLERLKFDNGGKADGFDPAEHYKQGRAALSKGAYLKAVEELDLVVRYAPDYKDARELLSRAHKEKKEAFGGYMKKGTEYFEAEEMGLAIKEWDKALELEPGNANALDYRAKAVEVLKRLEKIRGKDGAAR
ncbi:MAG: hypothetical protein HZB85_07520 [Deltaproteobacteria bacterium]|nr:hypothetical protein [Deltaproteobacteria bacterium]